MEAFQRALAFVLDKEGYDKLTDDPRDRGGRTKWGISQLAYPTLNIATLTQEQATQLYRRDFWLRGCCDGLPAPIGFMHFDASVNQGIRPANRMLQQAAGVDPDGEIGPKSLAAINRMNRQALCLEYATRRILHYAGLRTFETYGLGWVRRTHECLAIALALREP